MKSWIVHYMNKFPGCAVQASESSFSVLGSGGLLVSLQKNGAGQWVDMSEELGLPERHDLAPIPKDARVHKVQDGKIGLAEEHADRKKARGQFMEGGKVLSCDELQKKHGWEFCEKQKVVKAPAQKSAE